MKINFRIGQYEVSGHRFGKPLNDGDKGFAFLPMKMVKIENTALQAHRANRPDLKGKGADRTAPLHERDVVSAKIVQKSVISVRKTSGGDAEAEFTVRYGAEKFSISRFEPIHDVRPKTLSGPNFDVSHLETAQEKMFEEMGLVDEAKQAKFKDELSAFVLKARELFRDPVSVSRALKPLNDQLGSELGWNEADYKGVDILMVGNDDVMLPNYAVIEPLIERNNEKQSEVLLRREAAAGVNVGDTKVAAFDGFATMDVNSFVADGHLYGENENRQNFMIHGGYSHRLQWECIREWIQEGSLKVPGAIKNPDDDKGYDSRKLLATTVYVKTKDYDKAPIWLRLVDSADDTRRNSDPHSSDFRVDPEESGMSCLAPNQIMTTIKCFGADLGLHHLQKYLNDSAVKRLGHLGVLDSSQATYRKEASPEELGMKIKTAENDIFKRMAFLLNSGRPPSLSDLPFSLPKKDKAEKESDRLEGEANTDAEKFLQAQLSKYKIRDPSNRLRSGASAAPGAAPSTQPDDPSSAISDPSPSQP